MKRKVFVLVVLLVAFIHMAVYAKTMEVGYDTDTCAVTVSGDMGESYANKRILLRCVCENDSRVLAEDIGVQYTTDYYKSFRQTKTDNDGKYIFENIKIQSDTGAKYDFIITVENEESTFRVNSKYIPSLNELNTFIQNVSNSTGKSVYDTLEHEAETGQIGIDLTLYKMLTTEGRQKASNAMSGISYVKASDVSSAINSASAECLLLYSIDADAMDMVLFPDSYEELNEYKTLIAENNGYGSFESKNGEIAKALKNIATTDRIGIYRKVMSHSSKTAEDFYDRLSIACISFEINDIAGYGDISAILEKYSDSALSGLNYGAYSACKYKNDINDNILKKSFSSTKELCDYVNRAVIDYNKKSTSTGGGGGGGVSNTNASSLNIASAGNAINQSTGEMGIIFSDMAGFEWASDAVISLYEKNIVSGVGEGLFQPGRAVKRKEFIKMLLLSIGVDTNTGDTQFRDVDNDAWYAPYVYTAYKENIVKGINNDEFGVDMPVTRQDAATLIWRAANKPEVEFEMAFSDIFDISEYAVGAIGWMQKERLVSGYPDNTFKPKNPITRAETALILKSFIEKNSK